MQIFPCPHPCLASPVISLIHKNGAFVTSNEPKLMHYNNPKFMGYIRFTCCHTSYGFGQICKGVYSPFQCHAGYFQGPRSPPPVFMMVVTTPPIPLSPGPRNTCIHLSFFTVIEIDIQHCIRLRCIAY